MTSCRSSRAAVSPRPHATRQQHPQHPPRHLHLHHLGAGFEDGDDDTSRLKLARAFRTARLIKLVRLIRGSRVLSRWRTRITVSFASLSIISLVLELLLASHWLACLLSLQTAFGPRIDSWFGTFGWCTDDPLAVGYDEKTEMACASDQELYLVCLHWGFGIVAGFGPDPETGPYPPLERALEDGGLKRYTDGELVGTVAVLRGPGRAVLEMPWSLAHSSTRPALIHLRTARFCFGKHRRHAVVLPQRHG